MSFRTNMIMETSRAGTTALTLEETLADQKQIKAPEFQWDERRRSLFESQVRVNHQRGARIANIERKLTWHDAVAPMFAVRRNLA